VRDAWLNLYSTFTPEQKAVVKGALQQRMARLAQFREKMRQRHGG
jgi:Spy/CpxP family protein refolding chaperone